MKDGLIGDPHKCKFDPASLLCKGADSDNCLTRRPSRDSEDRVWRREDEEGRMIWTGFEPGTELQVASLRSVPTTQPGGGWDSIRILGHQNAD